MKRQRIIARNSQELVRLLGSLRDGIYMHSTSCLHLCSISAAIVKNSLPGFEALLIGLQKAKSPLSGGLGG